MIILMFHDVCKVNKRVTSNQNKNLFFFLVINFLPQHIGESEQTLIISQVTPQHLTDCVCSG